MDGTLDEVAKHCGLQLRLYTDCIDTNKGNWQQACLQQRHALTRCSETHVTLLKLVKEQCADVIKNYDQCVQTHSTNPEVCANALKALYDCTQRVAQDQPPKAVPSTNS
ncbi:hypothetical protein IWQ61_004384 [Dispira simplex]|nr:hypothetical protein IWQ61_004384 [Dispira simplex]